MGKHAATAVPALTEALDDDRLGVRLSAIEALGSIGASASSAVPALEELLEDQNAFVRSSAAKTLRRIRSR